MSGEGLIASASIPAGTITAERIAKAADIKAHVIDKAARQGRISDADAVFAARLFRAFAEEIRAGIIE